ncbi:aspartate-semialdehyde dehydrogenase [Thermosulfidibacter takaii ABI70S6]|uniref:Aspartate-semialdehyde dehydrogenase n=1 Tax=Thermosulfidibacter takaii (strain DSM 17441 / JCM 13301 / NBRC 103674 / ABI70S6) TaxID=1298851 RepID=A0A0S3QTP8_THET7|nr:aspartate-semialdehyde dehydrogenase [Thermosulfidibacter takaii]BAT71712.1 aspartate-semialdehyde dehydrogenase [Thermosulfidibacter takaii ABI70S6]
MGEYVVAVAGATGAVGREMLKILEERNFPVKELRLFASPRSEGLELEFKGEKIKVQVLKKGVFKGCDIALFSCGGSRSLEFAPDAAKDGCVVIDNSSAWRMDPDVPLVVPEVNPHAIADYKKKGIIANPNCSTIQMVVPLKAIYDYSRIKRIFVATYQSTSGAGKKAMDELLEQTRAILNFQPIQKKVFPHQIAFNCLPHIDVFLDNGYTKEEMKMVNETRKIMEDPEIQVSPTCVRVPVFISHSEAVTIETETKVTAEKARELLSNFPGVKVVDDPSQNLYPLAIEAAGKDECFVGRIREDVGIENGLSMWIVADNLRKGAALNAVQIAEILVEKYL